MSHGSHYDTKNERGQRQYKTLATLLPYLWPAGEWTLRARVVVALALLVGSKVANVYVPLFYKDIIDALSGPVGAGGGAARLGSASARLVVAWLGSARLWGGAAWFGWGVARRGSARLLVARRGLAPLASAGFGSARPDCFFCF